MFQSERLPSVADPWIQNNEKPDAKLMSLLRAARGGIIEDLTVDWGVQDLLPKEGKSFDDDFELVSDETASIKTAVEPPPSAPISLFDTSTASTSEDLGPKKMVINLAPPPPIQQAPKSDKLPVPLYPGFRCSIFSIIKVSGQTSFSSCVRINGKVMGSPVTLEIPVTPIALDGGAATHLTDIKVKLLHSLAARALIQDWEDKEKTEKNRAEIERLGTRYSLASSATSFLAIDGDTKKEVEREEVHYQEPERGESETRALPRAQRYMSAGYMLSAAPAAAVPPPPPPSGRAFGSMGGGGGGIMKSIVSSSRSYMSRPSASRSSAIAPAPPPTAAPMDSLRKKTSVLSSPQDENERGLVFDRIAPMTAYSSSARLTDAESTTLFNSAPRMRYAASPTSAAVLTPDSYGSTLTIESIARAQQFDGGFPVSGDFIRLLIGSSSAPALPGELAALSGSQQEKQNIWVTVLVLAVLAKKFAGDRESWEMLAEKSTEFVETSLASMGVDSGNAVTVINQLKTAATRNV